MIDFENTKALQELIRKYPGRVLDYLNSCNETQWLSKRWLAEELNLYLYKHGKRDGSYIIALLGGWYGLLAHILIEELGVEIKLIESFDMDYMTKKVGKILHGVGSDKGFQPLDKDIIKFRIKDVAEINFDDSYDIIINTSTEHMEQEIVNHTIDTAESGTIFIFQSNNFFGLQEHINCSESEEEFNDRYHWHFDEYVSLTKPWPTSMGDHERYMSFGIKK